MIFSHELVMPVVHSCSFNETNCFGPVLCLAIEERIYSQCASGSMAVCPSRVTNKKVLTAFSVFSIRSLLRT
jgi:hypothetical protein